MFNSSINIFLLISVYLISQKWWRILSLLTMTVVFFNFSLISKLFGYVYLTLYSAHTDFWFLYSHFIVQLPSHVWLFAIPQTAACQASLSITNSQNLLKLMSMALVMWSNHLILYHPLLHLPSIFPSIRAFSNESVLCIRWPKYWSFCFNISPSSEHPGLIPFRMDWLDLLAVQGTLKSLLQHHSSKASVLWSSVCFIV